MANNVDMILIVFCIVLFLIIVNNFYTVFRANIYEHKRVVSARPSSNVALVAYCATWCPHSRMFLENGWKKLKSNFQDDELADKIQLKEVLCDDKNNEQICKKMRIPGFPTVLLHKGDDVIEYKGDRTDTDMIKFLHDNM